MHDTLLLFGATGDLAVRQLFPSLLHLLRDRLLQDDFRIVAVARQPYDPESFRNWIGERLQSPDIDAEAVSKLLAHLDYIAVDLSDPAAIAPALSGITSRPCVSYLATPPYLFVPIAKGLKDAGLLEDPSRLVLEKPIGSDLESARAINAALNACLSEDRIFRIDHYLGKAAVQNLLALRFGNTLLEAVWHHRWIESVDILVAETAGVDGRESYYADYGALRDMIQNHVMQLLCLIAMEPPTSLDADVLRDEKLKVLRALRPFTPDSALTHSVRGRYEAGLVDGAPVRGFSLQSVQGREPVETFVALRASIDNWRWAGVPFRLCTGKRLAERVTQVVVTFRPTSHWLFEKPRRERATSNRLVLRLQPQENVELELMSSLAGPEWGALELQSLPLDLSLPSVNRRIAYERLLLDALNGNSTLFVRSDEVEAAWTWIDSIIAAWREAEAPILPYMAGSWGPAAAANFLPHAPARTVGAQRGSQECTVTAPSDPARVLLADVGGTNVRFALADVTRAQPLLGDTIRRYRVVDYATFTDAALSYVAATGARPSRGVFAFAGQVRDGEVQVTNHAWSVSRESVRSELALDDAHFINDFAAMSLCVPLLGESDAEVIGDAVPAPPDPSKSRTFALVGPGTGLGVGALLLREGRASALETEGGHISFAPRTEEEIEVLRRLTARFGRVSNERLLCGSGLANLHEALGYIHGTLEGRLSPEEITRRATAASDPTCVRAVHVFCELLGGAAGDYVLAFGAWDGVYLAGGMPPLLLPWLRAGGFRRRFEDKGRFSDELASTPTLAILHPDAGLLGAAACAVADVEAASIRSRDRAAGTNA